jgi:hypothetical protein
MIVNDERVCMHLQSGSDLMNPGQVCLWSLVQTRAEGGSTVVAYSFEHQTSNSANAAKNTVVVQQRLQKKKL